VERSKLRYVLTRAMAASMYWVQGSQKSSYSRRTGRRQFDSPAQRPWCV